MPLSMDPYAKVLETISKLPKGKGKNLSRMENLCRFFGHPERSYPTIHVAGTNGKGSVCTKIAAALNEEGYRCGLYTSPHITTFRERIQIGGKMISEEELCALFTDVQKHSFELTFFEMATILAFLYFREQNVDVAVIETGLGGKWDATNVVQPLASVITSIGFDHMELLGNTLEEIALEKAGIIKPGIPVVIGPDTPQALFLRISKEQKSPLFQSEYRCFDYDVENREIARLALKVIEPHFPLEGYSIAKGLEAKPPCRFEKHKEEKEIILDVAHNAHGFDRLIERLLAEYPNHRYRFVVGFSKGKEIEACANLIQQIAHAVHLVSGDHPRLASVAEISRAFSLDAKQETSIAEGIQNALHSSAEEEIVVVAGSFFIMPEARAAISFVNKS